MLQVVVVNVVLRDDGSDGDSRTIQVCIQICVIRLCDQSCDLLCVHRTVADAEAAEVQRPHAAFTEGPR